MPTVFATGISEIKSSTQAGKDVAHNAWLKLGRKKPDIALLFGSESYHYDYVVQGIKSVVGEVPIIGCSGSSEFTEDGVATDGLVLALISSDEYKFGSSYMINDIDRTLYNNLKEYDFAFSKNFSGIPYHTALVFVDGLAGLGENIVSSLSSKLGSHVQILGGAASDSLRFKRTDVYFKEKAYTNAATVTLVSSSKPLQMSIKHGHIPLQPRLQVTRSSGHVLQELNNQPALQVWKNVLELKALELGIDLSMPVTDTDISRLLLKHVAGIAQSGEYKVRHPMYANKDDSIVFNCNIQIGDELNIMDTTIESQILSTRNAAESVAHATDGKKIAGILVFDCVCRSMLLGKFYTKALEEIKKVFPNTPVLGFHTYGEIAQSFTQLHGFHNTTIVIAAFLE